MDRALTAKLITMADKEKYDRSRITQHGRYGYRGDFGKASEIIICPFCNTHVRAYIWSLAGGGKKCPGCGAMHTIFGQSMPLLPVVKRLTLASVTAAIQKKHPKVQLVKGNGYYYIHSDDDTVGLQLAGLYSTSIPVNSLNQLTLEQWVEAVDSLYVDPVGRGFSTNNSNQ